MLLNILLLISGSFSCAAVKRPTMSIRSYFKVKQRDLPDACGTWSHSTYMASANTEFSPIYFLLFLQVALCFSVRLAATMAFSKVKCRC